MLDNKSIDKSQQSLFLMGAVVFPTHEIAHKHHRAHRTARNGCAISRFGLTHRSKSAAGSRPESHRNWKRDRDSTGQISVIGQSIGRQPHRTTGVLARLRQYLALKNISVLSRRACVESVLGSRNLANTQVVVRIWRTAQP